MGVKQDRKLWEKVLIALLRSGKSLDEAIDGADDVLPALADRFYKPGRKDGES